MSKTVFSLEKYYQTMPPQQIGSLRVGPVLEYLVFSGSPLYLSFENEKLNSKVGAAYAGDVKDKSFLIEVPNLNIKLNQDQGLSLNFGYKRKRASFQTKIQKIENNCLFLDKPESLVLTNLRRNPRLEVDKNLYKQDFNIEINANTSVGPICIKKARIFEISQLGMSLFINRNSGLLLPGDKITEIKMSLNGLNIFSTQAVVSRINPLRQSNELGDSYEIVILFRNPTRKQGPSSLQRSAKRIPILDSSPCFFSAEHPFFPGRKVNGQVFEISSSGLSCLLEKTSFPIVPGMNFHNCQLQLPYCASRDLVFEVIHSDFRSDGEMNQFRIGGEFVNASVELLKDISGYENKTSTWMIEDLTQDDLDLLWEFMFETNFIYQKKRKQIQRQSKEILETYKRLLAKDNPIVKKIIFKEDQEIKGHLSGVLFYDNTWIIQHLNAAKASSGSAAQSVLSNMTNFLYDSKAYAKNDIYYIMSFYRPNNIYPAILFGESTKRINDTEKCASYDFSFGLYDSTKSTSKRHNINISQDDPQSIVGLVNLLIRDSFHTFLRATGLSSPDPLKMKIQKEFKKLELNRERHILSASFEGSSVYALVEVSSPGLNLSELTNSIYLFSDSVDQGTSQALSEILVEKVYQEYFEPLEVSPTILIPFGTQSPQNVVWSKIYTCWILSETAMPEFESISKDIFKNIKQLVTNFKQTAQIVEHGKDLSSENTN